jgi:hypothetical protein
MHSEVRDISAYVGAPSIPAGDATVSLRVQRTGLEANFLDIDVNGDNLHLVTLYPTNEQARELYRALSEIFGGV